MSMQEYTDCYRTLQGDKTFHCHADCYRTLQGDKTFHCQTVLFLNVHIFLAIYLSNSKS